MSEGVTVERFREALARSICAASLLISVFLATDVAAQQEEIAVSYREHLEQWQRQGIRDYIYTYYRGCFCARMPPVRVVVRDKKIVSVTNSVTNEEVRVEDLAGQAIFMEDGSGYLQTPDTLFLLIAKALEERANVAAGGTGNNPLIEYIKFDETHGYPARFNVSYRSYIYPDGVEEVRSDSTTGYGIYDFAPEP